MNSMMYDYKYKLENIYVNFSEDIRTKLLDMLFRVKCQIAELEKFDSSYPVDSQLVMQPPSAIGV